MMAFKREFIENSDSEFGQTKSPLDRSENDDDQNDSKTLDSKEISERYENDLQSDDKKLETGTYLPKDLTVKLVRSDTSNWEIFLSSLYSLTLTIFGIFLGAWLSVPESDLTGFSVLEKIATFFLLFLSVVLITIWIIIKVRQRKRGIRIPQEVLETFKS